MKKMLIVLVALMLCAATAFAEDRVVEVKVRADSEHGGLEAWKAMDGNPMTIWHSVWFRGVATPLPHEIAEAIWGGR